MRLTLTSLSARSGGEEIAVGFETVSDDGQNTSRECFMISSKQYLTLGLTKGECDTETYDTVCTLSEIWSATKRGIRLLSYGRCSERALARKLVGKGYTREISEQAVRAICSLGLIDGANDAKSAARTLEKKLWGRSRISSELFAKGFSREDIQSALDFLEDEGVDYVENCRRLFKKKFGAMPKDPKEKQKTVAALMRYGYTAEQIRAAIARK